MSYNNLGALQRDAGLGAEAEASSQKAIDLSERLSREHPEVPRYRSGLARALGNWSYTQLFAGHPQAAIVAAQRALDIDPSHVWMRATLAHGYLLDNQYAKALAIYTEYKDQKEMFIDKTFDEEVLEDFQKLRAKGISHPDMAKIEQLLRPSPPQRK